MWKSEWCKGNYFLIPQHEGHSEPTQMIQSQRKFKEEDKDEDPASLLSSWNFGEVWTSLATWEQTGSPCLWRGSSLTLLFTREGSWVLYEWLTELGLLLDCIKKQNGLSSCEILRSSHGHYESSLEPDPSWNAKSLIQADALPWPRNLGKRHCDKVASYLTAFLLK